MADAVSDHIAVQADPDTVMDVIVDYESYPDWQPEIKEAEILETDEDGWGTRVRFAVDAKVLTAEYVLRYTYGDDFVEWHLDESGQLDALDGIYRLQELEGGRTDVEYELDVVPSVRLPGMLRRQAARRIVDGALKGLKQRVESSA